MTMLIRKNVAPMIGSPVRLLGADPTTPKGIDLILGAGWTQKSNDQFVFDAPPGTGTTTMQFSGLVIGAMYRITFISTAATGYGGMAFRPGDFADDTDITQDQFWDITFEAQNSNGITRFTPQDVTGVSRITFSVLKLVAL